MTTDAPSPAQQLLRDFLRGATPQQRHTFVRGTNYDDGDAMIRFVLDDPSTDRATALAAYWMLGAGFHTRFASAADAHDHERPTWELLRVIEDRYAAGFYADHGLGFDPTDDDRANWTTEYDGLAPVARPVPEVMLRPAAGTPVPHDEDAEDGLPLDVAERYVALVLGD